MIAIVACFVCFFFFSSRRRHTRFDCDWSSDVCSSDLFGAGFMLAVALVEVLPEAFARSGTAAPALVLVGYLAVHFTQHTLTPHFHFGEETHAVNRVAGTLALVGLLLHTFFYGVAIASAFFLRPALGVMVFIAIFLHKLPEGVTVSSLMMAG